jgi:hypothetical protein
LQLSINASDLTLLLIEDVGELLFQLALSLLLILEHLLLQLLFLFVDVLDLLIKHLNVQLKLLLYLDVVTHVSLILLQLLLVLLWRELYRFEC